MLSSSPKLTLYLLSTLILLTSLNAQSTTPQSTPTLMQTDAGIAATITATGASSLITTLTTVSAVTDKGKPKPKKTTHVGNGNGTDNGAVAVGVGGFGWVVGAVVGVAVGVAAVVV